MKIGKFLSIFEDILDLIVMIASVIDRKRIPEDEYDIDK